MTVLYRKKLKEGIEILLTGSYVGQSFKNLREFCPEILHPFLVKLLTNLYPIQTACC